MEAQNNWKWWLAVPGVNWLGLLFAGLQARKPDWVRLAFIYAALSSVCLGIGLLSGNWFLFWVAWLEIAVHSSWIQGEYQSRLAFIANPRRRLTSDTDLRLAQELGMGIDINRASIDDLLRLPGMSIIEARRIVEARSSSGPYLSADELVERAEISANKVRNLEALLQFCYYETTPALTTHCDINDASASELAQIEGISAALADRIVLEREAHGEYASLSELRDRLALPARTVARLVNRLNF